MHIVICEPHRNYKTKNYINALKIIKKKSKPNTIKTTKVRKFLKQQ